MSKNRQSPELLQELIINILSRLPIKSLLRFKCVSKPWLSLISNNPHFAKLHLQYKNSATTRLFLTTHKSFDIQAYCDGDFPNVTLMQHNLPIRYLWDNFFEFVGSCNGLICVAFDNYDCFVVFNPTTRQVRQLPVPKIAHLGVLFYGFGYDSKIDDYKIVRGVFFSSSEVVIEIFNLKGNSWSSMNYEYCSNVFEGKGFCLNGILHWAIYGNEYRHVIVRFDFVEERFLDSMPLPSRFDNVNLSLAVIDECLCVSSHDCFALHFGAWKMMDYCVQDSWTEIYQFSHDDFPVCKFRLELLYVAKSGHFLFAKDADNLIVYNPKDENIVLLGDRSCIIGGTVYVESLVSPNIAEAKHLQPTIQFMDK